MYYPNAVTLVCSNGHTQTYQNPGKHSLHLVLWKAYRDGWWIPTNGVHLCPDCKKKLDQQIGLPKDYGQSAETQKRFDLLDQLPEPPVQGDLL